MNRFKLIIPACSKYFGSVRLFVSGILSVENLCFDSIEDLKMAVTEGLNILILDGKKENIEMEFILENKTMTAIINNFDIERDDQNDMAFMVLRCLVDEVTLEDNKLLIKKTCNE